MLVRFWSEISRMFLFCVFGVDYFEAKKCVFYKHKNKIFSTGEQYAKSKLNCRRLKEVF